MTILPGLEGYAGRDPALGQWDTHPEVARAFVRWANVDMDMNVLEPSAGIGNIARAITDVGADVTCLEVDPHRTAVLVERGFESVATIDFLATTSERIGWFDAVCMNPPYESDGETRHMAHALTFAPRVCAIVRLVALTSAGRAPFWRSVDVSRLAVLIPRPVFAGTSGMDEIAFVEVRKQFDGVTMSTPLLEWLSWRAP